MTREFSDQALRANVGLTSSKPSASRVVVRYRHMDRFRSSPPSERQCRTPANLAGRVRQRSADRVRPFDSSELLRGRQRGHCIVECKHAGAERKARGSWAYPGSGTCSGLEECHDTGHNRHHEQTREYRLLFGLWPFVKLSSGRYSPQHHAFYQTLYGRNRGFLEFRYIPSQNSRSPQKTCRTSAFGLGRQQRKGHTPEHGRGRRIPPRPVRCAEHSG